MDFVRRVERGKFGLDIHLQPLLRWRTMSLAGTVDLRAAAIGTVRVAADGGTSGIATLHDGLFLKSVKRENEENGGFMRKYERVMPLLVCFASLSKIVRLVLNDGV
jgi:hypothetical protein